jgi:hypothetical protein
VLSQACVHWQAASLLEASEVADMLAHVLCLARQGRLDFSFEACFWLAAIECIHAQLLLLSQEQATTTAARVAWADTPHN